VAYIRKAGSKWRVQVERQGVRKSASFDTKSEASQWAAHEESAILSAARGHYPRRTFAEAVDEYLSRVSVRKRSLKWERNAFARLATHFGDKALIRDIDEAKVAAWRDARLQTVSGSTVQREANLLRNLFTVARDEWKWIGHSPFKGVKLPAENQPRYQVWRWPLVKRVLRAQRTGKTAEMQRAFHIALRTGMRLSEVLQAPGGFDARRRVVVLASSKTTGRVEVPVGRIAARLLTGAAFTVNANEGSVLFGKLCRELLIEDLTFHDARATALTLLSRKVDVLTLSKISRHKDIRVLRDHYYRESAEEIAARL
jgi:hypothetical protein